MLPIGEAVTGCILVINHESHYYFLN